MTRLHANDRSRADRGFATISTALLLGLVLGVGMSLITYVLSSRLAARHVTNTFSALQIAEAGIQQAIFCLNASAAAASIPCDGTYGGGYPGQTDVDIGAGTFTTAVTGGGAYRSIVSTGTTVGGYSATIKTDLTTVPPNDDIDFSYALQSGEGGAYMENNAAIQGTLYSNGDIGCQSTQAGVTGDMFVAKTDGVISKCDVAFHAYADSILDSKVHGDAYYDIDPDGIAGTTVDGTKFPGSSTPVPQSLPNIDIQFWRDSAEDGGIIYGDYMPADGETLGPVKIDGDLTLDQNVDITIAGPIWVVGDITTLNNSSFTLGSEWGENSTVILADDPGNETTSGRIDLVNNTGIYGSGEPTSHLLFSSTFSTVDDDTPAIRVANNASGAVFYALDGVLRLLNNAGAKSLAGHRLYVDQNGTVTYVESELAGLNFSNSPGGKWRILEGTWRQAK